jgi:hypothetical protein
MNADSPVPVKAAGFPWFCLLLNAAASFGLIFQDQTILCFDLPFVLYFGWFLIMLPASIVICFVLWLLLRRRVQSRIFWMASALWSSILILGLELYQLTPLYARDQAEALLKIAEGPALPENAWRIRLSCEKGQRTLCFDLPRPDFNAFAERIKRCSSIVVSGTDEGVLVVEGSSSSLHWLHSHNDSLTHVEICLEPELNRVHLCSWED